MRNRILAIAGIAVLVIGATVLGLAQAQRSERKHGGGHGDMVEHISRELNLTDAQKEQVKGLMEAQHATEEARHTKLDELRKQIDATTANGQFDEASVRPLATQQAELMTEQMLDHLRLHSKIYSLLTAEQRTKADQMMKQHGGEHRRGPGMHGPPPPPPGF